MYRRIARVFVAASVSSILGAATVTGCSSDDIDDARDRVCEEIEKLPYEEVQKRVDYAISELDKRGIKVTVDIWSHRDQLVRWINEVRRFLGCRDLAATSSALGVAQQGLHEGGPADYCGMGHGDGLVLHVSYCLNDACRRHDSCYARCSEPTNSDCMWSAPTKNCDDAFFEQSSNCSIFEPGTMINTIIVKAAARGLTLYAPTKGCGPGMKCPATGGQFGYGPCSVNRDSSVCKQCLQRVDPGLECRSRVCHDEPTPEDVDICYTANCPPVSECFGWSKEVAPPPPPPIDSCAAGCAKGFFCQTSTMTCVVDPLKNWIISLGTGRALAADGTGDPPDPQVCLKLSSTDGFVCTAESSDTHEPKWSKTFAPTSAFALMNGVQFQYIDVDVAFDDTICSGTMKLRETDFKAGVFKVTCSGSIGDWFAGVIAPE